MFTFLSEAKRRQHPCKPSVLTWYLSWSVDEIRCDTIDWLLHDAKLPALLCTDISYIRKYAPPTALGVALNPLDAILNPIEGYGWLECVAALEEWALGQNEIYDR
jgi:hypothetical protein